MQKSVAQTQTMSKESSFSEQKLEMLTEKNSRAKTFDPTMAAQLVFKPLKGKAVSRDLRHLDLGNETIIMMTTMKAELVLIVDDDGRWWW